MAQCAPPLRHQTVGTPTRVSWVFPPVNRSQAGGFRAWAFGEGEGLTAALRGFGTELLCCRVSLCLGLGCKLRVQLGSRFLTKTQTNAIEYMQIKRRGAGQPCRPLLVLVPAYSLPLPGKGGVSKRKEEAISAGFPTPATVSTAFGFGRSVHPAISFLRSHLISALLFPQTLPD